MDLDRSLDDTIKLNSIKGRGGKRLTSTAGSKRHVVDRASHGRQHINSTSSRSSHPRSSHTVGNRTPSKFHVNSRIGNKPSDQRVGGSNTLINSRLGRGVSKPHRGPGVGSRAVSSGAVSCYQNHVKIKLNPFFFSIQAKWITHHQQIE